MIELIINTSEDIIHIFLLVDITNLHTMICLYLLPIFMILYKSLYVKSLLHQDVISNLNQIIALLCKILLTHKT